MNHEAGPTNSLLDVVGLRVGDITLSGDGWLSGVTTVLAPAGGVVAGVDVRGGGPGTRETDLLDPVASVERVHAVTFSGGSAYGLAAASGVADVLGARHIGFAVGPEPHEVVPIVPATIVFDLGRGGDFMRRPTAEHGSRSAERALAGGPLAQGGVGAGTGAQAGGLKGGVGTASAVVPGVGTVAAFVVVNAHGDVIDPVTGAFLANRLLLPADGAVRVPDRAEAEAWARLRESAAPPMTTVQNTTVGVVATDATLTKAQCRKLAGMAHDGLARAVDPVHTLFDGDTFFGLSTGDAPAPDLAGQHALLASAATVVSRAIMRAMLAAESVTTAAGSWPSYRDVFPSAFA